MPRCRRGRVRIFLPPRPLRATTTPKPAPSASQRLEGTGTSPPSPTRGSAERRAGTAHSPDYKSHNAPDGGGGERGVLSGVYDLGASRPEVPEGPLWGWRSWAVSPCAVTAPTPPSRAPASTRLPRPGIARALPQIKGREDGRGDGGVGGRESEASDSRAGSGVQQQAEFGEASRGGAELGLRGVGLEWTGRG